MTSFDILDLFPEQTQRNLLKVILKGRRRFYPVALNGRTHWFRRNDLRDHLKQKFVK